MKKKARHHLAIARAYAGFRMVDSEDGYYEVLEGERVIARAPINDGTTALWRVLLRVLPERHALANVQREKLKTASESGKAKKKLATAAEQILRMHGEGVDRKVIAFRVGVSTQYVGRIINKGLVQD